MLSQCWKALIYRVLLLITLKGNPAGSEHEAGLSVALSSQESGSWHRRTQLQISTTYVSWGELNVGTTQGNTPIKFVSRLLTQLQLHALSFSDSTLGLNTTTTALRFFNIFPYKTLSIATVTNGLNDLLAGLSPRGFVLSGCWLHKKVSQARQWNQIRCQSLWLSQRAVYYCKAMN